MKRRRMMLVFSVLLLLGFLGAIALPKASAQTLVTCTDPRGCPDLTVNKNALREWHVVEATFSDTDCAVQEGFTEPGTRRLGLFTYNTPNQGPGDLIIGNPADHPDWFVFAPCHNHFHFKEYADYRLWTPKGYDMWVALRTDPDNREELSGQLLSEHPELKKHLVVGAKLGFCVVDVKPAPIPGQHEPRKYLDCGSNQGISVGWADEYFFFLDGQWIDVTDSTKIPPGKYVLEAEVNPERFFEEADYSNNISAVDVTVPPRK